MSGLRRCTARLGSILTELSDEDKPKCQRCTRAGFECLGYVRERIWRNASSIQFPQPQPLSSRPQDLLVDSHAGVPQMQAGRSSPPQELSLVAFEDNMCLSFMFSNYVWRSAGILWLEAAAVGKSGSLSLHATHALSQAAFGRFHSQPDIEYKGITKYGQCLTALAAYLAKPKPNSQEIVPMLLFLMHAVSSNNIGGYQAKTMS